MNVSFKLGEEVNGFKVINTNGLTEYTVENDDIYLRFRTDAGFGKNYSQVLSYYDKKKNRTYRAQRFLIKHVNTVQNLSNILYTRFRKEKGVQLMKKENIIKCVYKSQFKFKIDLDKQIIQWGDRIGALEKFYNGLTGEISSIAGVKGYSNLLKGYSYVTPYIGISDITECSDWDRLKTLFKI